MSVPNILICSVPDGDERIMRFCVNEETAGMGGIKSILEATPGYFKVHLFDRGYRSFQVHGSNFLAY